MFKKRPQKFTVTNKVNEEIGAPELRVIGEAGQNLGIMKRESALLIAKEQGLDLVEIAAGAKPPVARIVSFDKFRYQKEREFKKQRLAEKAQELKQIRITPRAALHDLEIKAKKVNEFLNDGHTVEIQVFLRGREKANKGWAFERLERFLKMAELHKVVLGPRAGGRGVVVQIRKT